MHTAGQGTEAGRAGRFARAGALVAALAGLAGAAAAQQAPASPESVYAFRPGVWLDAERGRAYLMRPGTGVEAVDLRSGSALWRAEQVQKPLWASDSRLLAQRMDDTGRISLVMLDVRGPQASELWSSSWAVPAGVRVSIDAGKNEFFHMQACERAGGLALEWKFDEIRKPFWAVQPEVEGSNRRVGGSLLLDPSSGALRESAQDACEPPRAPARLTDAPRPGARTAEGKTVRYPSADGRHYLASALAPSAEAEPRYAWAIHDAATNEVVARFEQPLLASWFVVQGDLVLIDVPPADGATPGEVEPPRLRAVRASTGDEVWSQAYRNTRFTGIPDPRSS
jgi:hypothetical protein